MVWETNKRVHSADNLLKIGKEPTEGIRDKDAMTLSEKKHVSSASDLDSYYSNQIGENSPSQRKRATFTLYLIRHGEALHNILEKAAKEEAKELAITEGHAPDSDETKARMEEARIGVLDDPDLLDAPLSDAGKNEAIEAEKTIRDVIERKRLPQPKEVLVSPLQRALQTANFVFPNHTNIRVREELRERQTLKAADTRMPTHEIRSRKSFARFSMTNLCKASIKRKLEKLGDLPFIGELPESDSSCSSISGSFCSNGFDIVGDGELEEKPMLRNRTKLLFNLLSESSHRDIAIVGHKGYLRELERGPFGQKDAKEFKNCEMRAYRVTFLSGTHDVQAIERIV